jgi:hypothetical protein
MLCSGFDLTLYDPDRSQVVRNAGRISTWNAFLGGQPTILKRSVGLRRRTADFDGNRHVTDTWRISCASYWENSPAKWHQYEP